MKKTARRYTAAAKRYATMTYKQCGKSGLKLPAISLGLWHNFGGADDFGNSQAILRRAFDLGITHFDLANNYGPPPGSAETNFGTLMKLDFLPHRDELIISSKAGYYMWEGPYGEWGSRKNLVASLDQSLKRMGLAYVDIFYSHRFDPDTPLEETIGALDLIVRQGKALYAGISNYKPAQTEEAARIARSLGLRLLIHQPAYSMLNRWIETEGLLPVLEREGLGAIVFSPLAQGVLTDKYLKGVPRDSRAARGGFLKPAQITDNLVAKVRDLSAVAKERGQTMAQMAIAWALRDPRVTSALVGASSPAQLEDTVASLANLSFSAAELERIETILKV